MLGPALALYGKHFGALVLTCALALVPASLVATGAVAFGVASLGSTGVAETQTTQAEQVQEEQRDLREKPPASVEDRDARPRQLGQEALERRSAFDVRTYFRNLIPIAYAPAIVAA